MKLACVFVIAVAVLSSCVQGRKKGNRATFGNGFHLMRARHYLRLNEYHIKLIKKGLRAAEAGKLVSHAEVKKMISKMGRAK